MKKVLYLECMSGISGDMTVGALLDLGADRAVLEKALDSLGVGGYHLHFGRTKKCGIDAFDFDVHLESGHGGADGHEHGHDAEGHGHDHSHEHGAEGHGHEHDHEHGTEGHGHEHDHEHGADGHRHEHGTDGHVHEQGADIHVHEHSHGNGADGHGHVHSGEEAHSHVHEGEYDHIHGHEAIHDHSHSNGCADGYDHFHVHNHAHSGEEAHGHDHDHTHSADHSHPHDHEGAHDHTHPHTHEGDHDHSHSHTHPHVHRNIHDIYQIISRLDAADTVKDRARQMFDIVAQAEARAHGIPVAEVHFHEVGAIDSIVDIISVAVCMDNLGIEKVVVSPLAEGTGYVRCQHGVIPVPVPATANIASANGLSLRFTDNDGEMVTPTGAAIAAAYNSGEALPRDYRITKIGIGAGKKEFKQANILRAMLIEEAGEMADRMWKLETNIDDCSGEALGFAMEELLKNGAADVWYTPVYMKKNRPAYQLSLLCRENQIPALESILFTHTTTIGIRRYQVERTVLDRSAETVDTPWGKAQVKVCRHKGNVYCYPEYESVGQICRQTGLAYGQVHQQVAGLAMEQLAKQ